MSTKRENVRHQTAEVSPTPEACNVLSGSATERFVRPTPRGGSGKRERREIFVSANAAKHVLKRQRRKM